MTFKVWIFLCAAAPVAVQPLRRCSDSPDGELRLECRIEAAVSVL
jgi:hypothetical protein